MRTSPSSYCFRSLAILASTGLLASTAAYSQEPLPQNPSLPEQAASVLETMKLCDRRRAEIVSELKKFNLTWPESISNSLQGPEGTTRVKNFLSQHGFVPDDFRWLELIPNNTPADLRTSLIALQARELLQEGPEKYQDQWPHWKKDAPTRPGQKQDKQEKSILHDLAQSNPADADAFLSSLAPKNLVYQILQKKFVEMERDQEKLRAEFIPIPPIKDIVKPGEEYRGASILARRLTEEGYLTLTPPLPTEAAQEKPDVANPSESPKQDQPIYTVEMADAVKLFQQRHDRKVDGILGPDTLEELNRSPDQEREILRLNLHRARMLPDEPGERHVIVNIPSTRLVAFSGSEKPVLDMKTIVGEDIRKHQTPVFRDVIETVEFCPYWNVPPSIAEKEIVPKALKNRAFFERDRYEIVSNYESGKTLPATGGNLSAAASGRLFIRQMPGPENALGRVKFLFPNNFNVYLHDTPKGQLFNEAERDFSHGCIRVERPDDLAEFVLGPEGWDRGRILETMDSGQNQQVKLQNPIPVYIIYLTSFPAWDDKDGRKVRFHPDLYRQDKALLPDTKAPKKE
jgi:murein L,D-transpeptidase YcbB/YkuD